MSRPSRRDARSGRGKTFVAPSRSDVRALAERHKVRYVETATDVWAHHVTRLAGDDVQLDDIELLLIALQRAGHLSRPDTLALQVKYLREATPKAPLRRLTSSQTC